MRSLQKHLSLILLSLFMVVSLIIVPQVRAQGGPPVLFNLTGLNLNFKTAFDYGREFCDKRSGDLMNLETWYSGKCGPGVDTLSGEGVGFSDIVLLQGVEYLIGPQYDSFLELIAKIIKGLQCASSPAECLKPETGQVGSDPMAQGIIPALAKVTTSMFTTRPASTIDYLAYVSTNLKNHSIVKESWAAGPGYGFTALSPILPLWRAFRNVSYLLFAIGFVLYGIMIMFRIRIDAKTAASIQLAIPKLIFTLIIITFSYAIVGLFVDLSTIAVALSINVLRAGDILYDTPVHPIIDMASGQFLGAMGSFIVNAFSAIVVSPFIAFNLLIGGGIGAIMAGVVGAISLGPWMGFIGWVLVIFVLLAIVYSFFKLIGKLFQAYFSIIVNLIFAPIILLGNLFPGTDSFGSWMRNIYGNLAVFPVASFFLVLSYALMAQPFLSLVAAVGNSLSGLGVSVGPDGFEALLGVRNLSSFDVIWTPPMTVAGGLTSSGNAAELSGWIGGSVGSLMLATIGFGLLMMASKYVEMVEKALKIPPFPYGAAISEALKGGYKGGGMIPAIGESDLYKRVSRATGLPAGTPFNASFQQTTTQAANPPAGNTAATNP